MFILFLHFWTVNGQYCMLCLRNVKKNALMPLTATNVKTLFNYYISPRAGDSILFINMPRTHLNIRQNTRIHVLTLWLVYLCMCAITIIVFGHKN